jgi:tetratricopeptide (TPR) repeat protein
VFVLRFNSRIIPAIVLFLVCFLPFWGISQDIKNTISDALSAGDTTLAISLLEKEIGLDPSYEYNYYTLGLIYVNRGDYQKAEEQFEIALEKNKRFWLGLYELGKVQLKLNKLDEAEKNFKLGEKKAKKFKDEFLNGKGLLHIARGEYDKADTELRKAIVEDETVAEYHINLGDANYFRNVYSTAISEYETALNLDTASLDVYFRWAEACLELKDYTCALDKLSIVLQKDSSFADAWMRAGGIYYRAARSSRNREEIKELYGKTIGAYSKYLELSGESPDSSNARAFFETGKSYVILRFYDEANKYLGDVLSIPMTPKDIYFYYGLSFQGLKEYDSTLVQKYDSALTYYNKHIEWIKQQDVDFESGIRDVELYRRMGECYEANKDRFNTINYFKKSLEYDSTQERLLYGVAVAYNYTQDYKNALTYYMKRIALGIDERFWSIYYNAATSALYLSEQGGGALVEEEEDLGLEDEEPAVVEEDPFANIDLADLAIGYLEKIVIDFWDKVMERESNQRIGKRALNLLASTYLYQKSDCANGVKYFERLLELEPDNCDALKALGFAYYGGICNENYGRAISYLKQALDCKVAKGDARCDDVDILLWLGQVYEFRAIERNEAKEMEKSKADYKIADDYYTECLKCSPGNNDCREGQRRVKWEH